LIWLEEFIEVLGTEEASAGLKALLVDRNFSWSTSLPVAEVYGSKKFMHICDVEPLLLDEGEVVEYMFGANFDGESVAIKQ
jgi:hypothetical protein